MEMCPYFLAVLNAHSIPYLFLGIKVIYNFKEKFLNIKKIGIVLGICVMHFQPMNEKNL